MECFTTMFYGNENLFCSDFAGFGDVFTMCYLDQLNSMRGKVTAVYERTRFPANRSRSQP